MKGSMLKAIALIQRALFPFMFPNISLSSHEEYKNLILLHLIQDVCYPLQLQLYVQCLLTRYICHLSLFPTWKHLPKHL